MHVLMTVNAAWNIWNFRRPVVEALIGDGHRVTVLAPPDDSVQKLEGLGCRVVPLEMSVKGLNPVADVGLMRRLRQNFSRESPDVILGYTIKNNLFGALAARPLGIPFIPNVTGLGTAFLSGGTLQRIASQLYRRAFRDLPVVFFQNTDDRDLFVKNGLVTGDQAHVLPGSGIDLAAFPATDYPTGSDTPTFLMIARLLRDKGVFEYVEAARAVKAAHPKARFQLLGDVDAANRSAIDAETAQSWVDQGTIAYLGTTDDVRPYIAAAHCVVLPSYREGAPRTLIEAAGMARPLIATDVPGCRAVVDDGINGYLCQVRDSGDLGQIMRKFLQLSDTEKALMGRAGRTKMEEQFDQSIIVAAYRKALAQVANHIAEAHPA